MPSRAFLNFERKMIVDVDRIIETHGELSHDKPGKRGLGHLTRGGVLLLCAAWELYLEELLTECVEVCIVRVRAPGALPVPVKRTISDSIRESKHHFRPLEMSGDGWKNVYREIASDWVKSLNTPVKYNVDKLFLKIIGLDEISRSWSDGDSVDTFVKARGDIAHRGRDAGYVTIDKLGNEYLPHITQTAIETDNAVSTYFHGAFEPNEYPWNRRQKI
jgi:hypothetical protein